MEKQRGCVRGMLKAGISSNIIAKIYRYVFSLRYALLDLVRVNITLSIGQVTFILGMSIGLL